MLHLLYGHSWFALLRSSSPALSTTMTTFLVSSHFSRKLKEKTPHGPQHTHPNFFWPGHLLDKLQLYLPSVTVDRSLMLFSCVQQRPPAYSVTCHSYLRWPIRNRDYMTCAYYDASKVYYINQSGPGDVKPSHPGAGHQCS